MKLNDIPCNAKCSTMKTNSSLLTLSTQLTLAKMTIQLDRYSLYMLYLRNWMSILRNNSLVELGNIELFLNPESFVLKYWLNLPYSLSN